MGLLSDALKAMFVTKSTSLTDAPLIPVFNNNGTTAGCITKANLASVLGGTILGDIKQNTSIGVKGSTAKGDYTGYGHYCCFSGAFASTVIGSPVTTAFHLFNVKLSDAVFTQILIKSLGDEIYMRTYTNSGYGSWYKFSGTVVV